jgi:hypothetical protein
LVTAVQKGAGCIEQQTCYVKSGIET